MYIMGDFNCYLDPLVDKHPPVLSGLRLLPHSPEEAD